MPTKVSNGFQWLEDATTGDPVGVRRHRDGKEFNVVTASQDGSALYVAGEPVVVGGGGITPDVTGTLAGRATHDAEAAGFVYLATDQTPAEYYFREGVSG